MAERNYEAAISLIDEAHAQDPNITTVDGQAIPYELHYAQKSSHYLSLRRPDASAVLKVAVRAQHFRRWEVPRSSYPPTKPGYLRWRSFLKKRQADLAAAVCTGCGFSTAEAEAVAALIRKEGLLLKPKKKEDEDEEKEEGENEEQEDKEEEEEAEAQVLEDVACLVFLDDQFDAFAEEHDDDKVVDILRKTWAKMSARGHALALQINMSERAKGLVGKALGA